MRHIFKTTKDEGSTLRPALSAWKAKMLLLKDDMTRYEQRGTWNAQGHELTTEED